MNADTAQLYHETNPFPPEDRERLLNLLHMLRHSDSVSQTDKLSALDLIKQIEALPERSNQALWEHMGGHGPAPKHFRPGYDALWNEFDRGESWLTWSRALMHLMPDDWQARAAVLKREFQAYWTGSKLPKEQQFDTTVRATRDGKLVPLPEELNQYKYINREAMEAKYR